MSKRKILYTVIAILVLVLCYIIGQKVVRPIKGADSYGRDEEDEYFYDYVLKSDELMYEGQADTTDMPGGKTVGYVEDDVYGKWYLLTPSTSMKAGIILDGKDREFSFEYMIHENVADLSDGMKLSVQIISEETNDILHEKTLIADADKKQYNIDLSLWKDSNVYIVLQTVDSMENEAGDWLVIKNAIID